MEPELLSVSVLKAFREKMVVSLVNVSGVGFYIGNESVEGEIKHLGLIANRWGFGEGKIYLLIRIAKEVHEEGRNTHID